MSLETEVIRAMPHGVLGDDLKSSTQRWRMFGGIMLKSDHDGLPWVHGPALNTFRLHKDRARIFDRPSIAFSVLLACMSGCGSGGGGASGGSSGAADVIAPTVTAMSPSEDTFGTGTNSQLTATFSESMDPAAINTDNFRLTDGTRAVPGTVSYDIMNRIAVFTPVDDLMPGARYTVTVITGIKDLKNNPLTTDFAWCFTTGMATDGTAPVLISTVPANATTGVVLNRKISATFSEEMDSSTLTPASFTVTGPGATRVPGTVAYHARTATFKPANRLAANTPYTAMVSSAVHDLAGNAMTANAIWEFTTGADANVDATAPVVIATSPANAESGVAIGRDIRVSLSEPMDPVTINTESFFVTGPGASRVIGTVAFDLGTNTAVFTRINHLITPVTFHPIPVSNMEPNTIYTVTLTTGARDLAGNTLANNRVWLFTTAP